MLYLYDNAIVNDLKRSFNPTAVPNPVVKVIDPEGVVGLAAQLQNDEIQLPIVAVSRNPSVGIDTTRTNFTKAHSGIVSVIDPKTNELYYEKSIPVNLSYELEILTTNTADMDELVKELLFKYTAMYFLRFTLPYECKRQVRFGVTIDPSKDIERKSGSFDYISSGKLHSTTIPLKSDGCVLVSYTAAKLKRTITEVEAGFK